MARYVRLPTNPSAPTPDDGGGFNPAPIGQALSLAKFGAGLGKLAGLPYADWASGALGGLSGLLGIGTNLASGNPAGAILPALQTANTASGWLGGPTLGAGLDALGTALGFGGGGAGALAGATGAETAAAMAPSLGLGGALGTAAGVAAPFVLPMVMDTHGVDLFDALFGTAKTQAWKQQQEWTDYAGRFPALLGERTAGAHLLPTLDTLAPEGVEGALGTASRGIRADDLYPAYDVLSRGQKVAKIPGRDLSGYAAAAPGLEADNYAAWLRLMDMGTGQGLDVGRLAGANMLGIEGEATMPLPGESYRRQAIDLEHGRQGWGDYDPASAAGGWEVGAAGDVTEGRQRPMTTTQEAHDLSRSIASLGQQFGISADLLPGASPQEYGATSERYQGAGQYLAPEQLEGLGLTPGHYAEGVQSFLKGLAPGVEETDPWKRYWG